MAYTPELSQAGSAALRRIAWAAELPMTKALEEVVYWIAKTLKEDKVCERCKDPSCSLCWFGKTPRAEQLEIVGRKT